MIENHNHKLQTNRWHREEVTHNNRETSERTAGDLGERQTHGAARKRHTTIASVW